jgi:hypothetical protein
LTESKSIPGYTFGSPEVPTAAVQLADLEALKITVGFTEADQHALRAAGAILAGQTQQIVHHWRSAIIAGIPHLARHSRSLLNQPLPEYLERSNRRFEQWIMDTCHRPYDQDWLNYQLEIAARHTSARKNQVDGVQSTPYVPFRDIIAFVAVMNQTIKPYLGSNGAPAAMVVQMHQAWCKSLQLQIALWGRLYTDPAVAPLQW